MTKEKQLRKQARDALRTKDQWRAALKRKVRMFYDLQRLAIQMEGRTYERPGGVSIDLHESDIAILEWRAKELRRAEKNALADVADHLKTSRFYKEILCNYKGVGPTMAAVIMSEFDIEKAHTVSCFWSFAGLNPIPAMRCGRCHTLVTAQDSGDLWKHDSAPLVECKTPIDIYESGKAARPVKGEKLKYNKFLKTKMVGVLGDCLLKASGPMGARTSEWGQFYENYKHRLVSRKWGRSDSHRHRAAVRYMVKMFLLDVWTKWREFEGLPVRVPYAEEYLDKKHSG